METGVLNHMVEEDLQLLYGENLTVIVWELISIFLEHTRPQVILKIFG